MSVIDLDHAVGVDPHAVGQLWSGIEYTADTVINDAAGNVISPISATFIEYQGSNILARKSK